MEFSKKTNAAAEQAPGSLNNERPRLPSGVALLAVFGIFFGAIGILSGALEFISSLQKKSDALSILDEIDADEIPGGRDALLSFKADQRAVEQLTKVLEATSEPPPYNVAYQVASFLMSILALAAGFGLFRLREWARRAEIWLIISATVIGCGYTYLIIPWFVEMLQKIFHEQSLGAIPFDPSLWLFRFWFAMTATLVLLHALIIHYLMKTEIKQVFSEQ